MAATGESRQEAGRSADLWAAGDLYEPYVGRWSRAVAAEFLPRLGVPAGARWLDVGCGTGALSQGDPRPLRPGRGARRRSVRRLPGPCAAPGAGPAGRVPRSATPGRCRFEDAAFDAVASGLVLNFVPDQPKAAAEMRRAVRPGGTVAAYVWDYADGMG